jgi:formate hydrogenlyase subunit 6/NADH:ubiquinone oxidoreductase subunit I
MNILTMLMRNWIGHSLTVLYPAQPAVTEGYRGLVKFDETRCTGCSMCAFHCTSRAIEFRGAKTEYKWSYDPGQCTFCGRCAEGCESHALSMEQACPPIYLTSGALKCAYTMQRKPPAPIPAAAPQPSVNSQRTDSTAGDAQ